MVRPTTNQKYDALKALEDLLRNKLFADKAEQNKLISICQQIYAFARKNGSPDMRSLPALQSIRFRGSGFSSDDCRNIVNHLTTLAIPRKPFFLYVLNQPKGLSNQLFSNFINSILATPVQVQEHIFPPPPLINIRPPGITSPSVVLPATALVQSAQSAQSAYLNGCCTELRNLDEQALSKILIDFLRDDGALHPREARERGVYDSNYALIKPLSDILNNRRREAPPGASEPRILQAAYALTLTTNPHTKALVNSLGAQSRERVIAYRIVRPPLELTKGSRSHRMYPNRFGICGMLVDVFLYLMLMKFLEKDLIRKKQFKDCYYATIQNLTDSVKDKETDRAFALSRLKELFDECSPTGIELALPTQYHYFTSEMMHLQNIRPVMVFAYSLNFVPKLIAALARIQVLQNRSLLLLEIALLRPNGGHAVAIIIKLDPIVKGAFRMYFYNPNRANVLKLDQHLNHPYFDDSRFEQDIQTFFSELILRYIYAKITCYDPEPNGKLNTESLAIVSVSPEWTPQVKNQFASQILNNFIGSPSTAINFECANTLLEMINDAALRESFNSKLRAKLGLGS